MAITKASVNILTSGTCAAASTKASPGQTGLWIACTGYYGGDIGYSISNTGGAVATAGTITFQSSPDNGTTVFDYYTIAGTLNSADVVTGTLWLDQGVMYVRAIAYGNTTNAVTCAANLQAITAV